MKIFVSWSGETSFKVACVFRDWLPSVIQCVQPFVSAEDIDKGKRWSTDISKELQEASYGLICVTHTNVESAWLNFEAGALSKVYDQSRVSPFLFGINVSEVQGPFAQFQAVSNSEEDIKRLVKSINGAAGEDGIDEKRLDKAFAVWYPKLQEQLVKLAGHKEKEKSEPKRDTPHSSQAIEEVLGLVREQYKLLNSPEKLLPPHYVQNLLRETASYVRDGEERERFDHLTFDLHRSWRELLEFLEKIPPIEDKTVAANLRELVARVDRVVVMLRRDVFMLRRERHRRSEPSFVPGSG